MKNQSNKEMKQFSILALMLLVAITGCSAEPNQAIKNSLPTSKIIEALNKDKPLLIKDKIITGDLDFSKVKNHYTFSTSNMVAQVNVPVTFLNCIFMGKVSTTSTIEHVTVTTSFSDNITFEACDFRGETSFDNTVVCGMVNFTGTIFNERVSFNNIHIQGRNAYFTSITAGKQFSMQESLFDGNADFFKAIFKGKSSFQGSEINGDLVLNDLKCYGKVDLSLINIKGDFLSNYAQFNEEFRLSDARIEGNTSMVSNKFTNGWMNNNRFNGQVNLTDTEISGKLDLTGSIFGINPELSGVKGEIMGLSKVGAK